jgi:hypothetical protein
VQAASLCVLQVRAGVSMQLHAAVLPFVVFLSNCTAIIDFVTATSSDRRSSGLRTGGMQQIPTQSPPMMKYAWSHTSCMRVLANE